MEEGFGYPNDPRSYNVGGCLPLVGSPKANWSANWGQTKCGSKTSMMLNENKDLCTLQGGIPGPHPGVRPGEG